MQFGFFDHGLLNLLFNVYFSPLFVGWRLDGPSHHHFISGHAIFHPLSTCGEPVGPPFVGSLEHFEVAFLRLTFGDASPFCVAYAYADFEGFPAFAACPFGRC